LKRWRFYAGILLLAVSVGGLFFWETTGREKIFMEDVITANRDIPAGTVLSGEMLGTVIIPKGVRLADSFLAGETDAIIGNKTRFPISEKQQISAATFAREDEELKTGESFFVIPASWIAMRTSALRRGDAVGIVHMSVSGEAIGLGTYRLAFVKDAD
jgi:hypothetical protein